jgi:hypothetical protein
MNGRRSIASILYKNMSYDRGWQKSIIKPMHIPSKRRLGIYRTGSSSNSVPSSVSINAFLETIKSIILENAIDRIRLLIYNAFRNVYRREK